MAQADARVLPYAHARRHRQLDRQYGDPDANRLCACRLRTDDCGLLQDGDAGAGMPVAITLTACVIAASSAATARETYQLDLDELGVPAAAAERSHLVAATV